MTRREPGPPTRWFGLETIRRLKSDQLGFYADMQARYGDTVRLRIGPHVVWLFFHPDSIDCVLRERADDFVRFEPVMRVLEQWNGESLLTVEGERWQQRRRLVVPSLGTTRVSDYGERILEATARTIERWRAVGQGEPLTVETDREMASLSLRVAASTLFDVTLEEEAGTLGDAVADLSEVAFQESLSPFRRPLWLPGALSARKRTAMRTLDSVVRRIVEERLAGETRDRVDVLSVLIDQIGNDPEALRNEVTTLLIAGHETSGATLTWTSLLLGADAECLREVQSEIDEVVGDRPPTAEDVKKLPLLAAVIQESLRLYPSAYALFPRRAVNDVTVGDTLVKRGQLVSLVPWVTQRDARWFGAPEAFRPERFLDGSPRPRFAYFPFGGGPRVCIGQGLALTELKLVLCALLKRFSPKAPAGPVEPIARFSLRPKPGLMQAWVPRD